MVKAMMLDFLLIISKNVPMDVRYSKSGYATSSGENDLIIRTNASPKE